jgi:cytochrome c5
MLKPLITVMVALVPLPAAAQGKPSGLPEGAGKERVEALCMRCHQARESSSAR